MAAGDWVAIGSDAKVRVNGREFAATGGNWRASADLVPRNSTESGRAKRVKSGMYQIELDFQGQTEEDVSPHAAPLFLVQGQEVNLDFAPFGFGSEFGFYDVPRFILGEVSGGFVVEGSQIQTLNFRGQSDGDFWLAH